ncbi:CD5 molecule isoform X1 [Alosa pseudoharengus]|uniref:CD5 molecule isoform X1 n=1 Tax=Alosa pseudoharengus TaxID=34774 RepID=UPI003F8B6F98
MERWLQLLVLFLGLLLVNTDSQNLNNATSTSRPPTEATKATTVPTSHPIATSTRAVVASAQPFRELALVRVKWSIPCKGAVRLTWPEGGDESVCFLSPYKIKLVGLCPNMKCGHFQAWGSSGSVTAGLYIHRNGTMASQNCTALHVQCTGCSGEVVAYKAITGLLLVLVLGVLLLRFGKPTYTALRKRLSQSQQTRWIGPTQSQSVYYNREQQAGLQPNNNTFKRHSYPAALEKLTVTSSREPSSNRNSDYSYN